jgi:phospho-N-acetylmuramoyl-pentapeptide-transferase
MGGIIFILGILTATLILTRDLKAILMVLLSTAFGIIGFIDDYIKVVLKRNLGLTAGQKFTAQLIVSVIFVAVLYNMDLVDTKVYLPFIPFVMDLKWLYMFFTVFVILGTVNSVNLTDGLDGLAAGITVIVSIFFTFAALMFGEVNAAIFAAAITGGCLGFLLFNKYPAKVFMGDTGSLFLGGAVSSLAVALKLPIILIIVGGVYLAETLSVILQVISFKTTGKRIFKMSPLHHHFEMIGWKETKVVTVFVAVTILLSIIGWLSIQHLV